MMGVPHHAGLCTTEDQIQDFMQAVHSTVFSYDVSSNILFNTGGSCMVRFPR